MPRTRGALLDAAHRCLAARGLRATTMVDVAAEAGVAKGTLYNHFRTKGELVAALVEQRVAGLCALEGTPEQVLAAAAEQLADDAAVRRLAAEEPAALLPLLAPSPSPAWDAARARLEELVGERSDVALRWLLSGLLWPVPDAAAGARAVVGPLGSAVSDPTRPVR